MQLRHKFFLALSLLTSVPLLIVLFGAVDRVEQEVTARTESSLQASLDKMAGELELLFNSQRSIALGLARVPAVRQFADEAAGRDRQSYDQRAEELSAFFLNYQHAVPAIQALRFIDGSGKSLVKVKEGRPIEPEYRDSVTGRYYVSDLSQKDFFKRAMAGKHEVSMSNFEMGQVEPGEEFCPPMVRYSVLVKDEVDRVDGLLVVNMWGERVDTTVEAALGGHPGQVYVVEINPGHPRDGIFLYHPDSRWRFADQTGADYRFSNGFSAAEWQRISQSQGFGSLFTDDGRMFFFRPFAPDDEEGSRWLLVIESSAEVLLAPIITMRHSIWLLLAGLLVVSLLVAVVAAVRLSRPVHDLATLMTRYADGERSARYRQGRRDEIGAAGRAFNYLVERLERVDSERRRAERAAVQSERLAAVGQLAAGVGHEINNPLMNIMSLASLIEQSLADHPDQEVRSDLKLLQKEGRRCARIVQGILNFARETTPTYQPFDLAALVKDGVSLMQHRITAADIRLQLQLHPTLPMEGDPNQLQQVLVNVLLNALQAAPAKSTIHIVTHRDSHEICLEILDQGPGIAEGDMERVFNPFFTTKEAGQGTGLGLSVSYGIVKRHGGHIRLENTRNAGLRVLIVLPVRAVRQTADLDDDEPQLLEESHVG